MIRYQNIINALGVAFSWPKIFRILFILFYYLLLFIIILLFILSPTENGPGR